MMMFIPSRSRADRHVRRPTKASTIHHLPFHWDVTFVVPESQLQTYARMLRWRDNTHFVGLPDHWQIAETRLRIGQLAEEAGEDCFMMWDDDVRLLVRRGADTWKLRNAHRAEYDDAVADLKRALYLPWVSHAGFSPREGNNRMGVGGRDNLVRANTRVLRAYAWRTGIFLRVHHGRVAVMEDFDTSLQALRLGWENRVLGYWANGQGATGDAGGCSDYRTVELHNEEGAKALRRLHPNYVSLRTKKNVSGGINIRTEVTVQWQQAAKDGRKNRGKPIPMYMPERPQDTWGPPDGDLQSGETDLAEVGLDGPLSDSPETGADATDNVHSADPVRDAQQRDTTGVSGYGGRDRLRNLES